MNEREKMMKKTNIFWTLKVSKTWHLWFHFLLLFSICQFFKVKTLLFEWQHLISLKLWYLHSIPLFEQKRCHFLDLRAKESEEKVTTNSARQKHSILQKNEQKTKKKYILRVLSIIFYISCSLIRKNWKFRKVLLKFTDL